MEYLIDDPKFDAKYSREEVQKLLEDNEIDLDTKIWTEAWGEWKKLGDSDFFPSSTEPEVVSGLPDNLFLSARSFLAYIDNGSLFTKPFSWLYACFAITNLVFPFYLFYLAFDNNLFSTSAKIITVFFLVWFVILFASWISFQIWWDRKSKLTTMFSEGDEFVATPVFSHFIQTVGEWLGIWIGIVGFFVALLSTLILGDEGDYFSEMLDLGFLKTGIVFVILMPMYGFLILVVSRFMAEQFRALSSIANNSRKLS